MQDPAPRNSLEISQTAVSVAPGTLSTLGARACFVLVLYDPKAHVGAMAHLQLTANSYLAHYVKVNTLRMLAEMRGKGALRGRVIGNVILGPTASESALLRTISGIVRAQGIADVKRHRLGAPGHEIRFDLENGNLIIEHAHQQAPQRSEDELVTELGARLLAMHSVRRDIAGAQPDQPLEQKLQQVVDAAAALLEATDCVLALNTKDGLTVCAASGRRIRQGAPDQAWRRVGRWIQEQGKPVILDGWPARFRARGGNYDGLSIVGAPLSSGQGPAGVLCAMRPANIPFDDRSLHLLGFLSEQASLAIHNSRRHDELAHKAVELESIIQSVGEGMVVVDPGLRLIMANPVARKMFDLGEIATGQRLPADSPLNAILARARQESRATEEIELGQGPQPTTIQASVSNVTDPEGRMQGIVAALRDVTAQKELEHLRSELMRTVSHELRTPLHSIRGFVDLILMGKTGKVNELQRDFLTTVKQQSAQLQHILDDLLEFSRQEYGQVELTLQALNLGQLVRDVCRKLSLVASDAGVRLVNAMPAVLPRIEGDSVRLEQVLSNLVDNACKFTPRGGRVTVGATLSGHAIKLWVADTGIGIAHEEQERVFEKYYQVSRQVPDGVRRKGAGLGLTICKRIVEQHQGDIWVESDTGKGSTFFITLPLATNAEMGTAPAELLADEPALNQPIAESASPVQLPAMPSPILTTGKSIRLR
jgi:signal transduction histidine kinase/chemotaxis receptor (MCP) glutamine deamidase CheD